MLHHVEINVSDLTRSREFWEWFLTGLGYDLFQEWEQGFSFKQGKTYLVFVQTEGRFLDASYHRKSTGLNHLAFHAESRGQVDEMLFMLKQKGIPILYEDKYPYTGGPEHYAVFFEDPDRIKVEFACED
ncbi:VOC family protein [Paenibacillus sp.]|jgi:catechol 2,3-dioxygenase-like lactoylglutathione lyase family enzyme|uniref:VOC family protein n=1 Tax=Paenibacillus sp. TaxID=58172 RepID=UPI002836DCF9|nr:VOC family protein [Paenibacillus sp.]MDR0271146.1 VOC family protein [Paenibacillus sp.]